MSTLYPLSVTFSLIDYYRKLDASIARFKEIENCLFQEMITHFKYLDPNLNATYALGCIVAEWYKMRLLDERQEEFSVTIESPSLTAAHTEREFIVGFIANATQDQKDESN